MGEHRQSLILDLKHRARKLRSEAHRARTSTVKQRGETEFATRCHTLAEAHDYAAEVYEDMASEVERNPPEAASTASELKESK
jgi:hypothetical protein